jgi:hypothetical protein
VVQGTSGPRKDRRKQPLSIRWTSSIQLPDVRLRKASSGGTRRKRSGGYYRQTDQMRGSHRDTRTATTRKPPDAHRSTRSLERMPHAAKGERSGSRGARLHHQPRIETDPDGQEGDAARVNRSKKWISKRNGIRKPRAGCKRPSTRPIPKYDLVRRGVVDRRRRILVAKEGYWRIEVEKT